MKKKPRKGRRLRQATHELVDLEVQKVDLVGNPATGDTFLVMRSEEASEFVEPDPEPEIEVEAQEVQDGPESALEAVEVEAPEEEKETIEEPSEAVSEGSENIEEVERQRVPAANASTEEKRIAQKERARRFGVEALEGKGENLSYPSGSPTVLRLYGDPVNLKYPLGRANNQLDLARANNARARFKQAADVYQRTQSKRVIHTRIVRAQLSAGASPSYNPEDPLDKLLPSNLKERLQRSEEVINEAELLTGQPIDPAFQEIAVETLRSIVAEALALTRAIQDLPAEEGGLEVIPEETLEGMNALGLQVSRAMIQIGLEEDPDSGQTLWNSIQRAGAKMAKTRLKRLREALTTLTKILTELEGSEERKMEQEQVNREEETTPETAPEITEETSEEETKEVKRAEEKSPPEKVPTKEPDLTENVKRDDKIMGLLEKLVERQDEMAKRLEQVERAAGTPNGDPEPDDTQDVSRANESFWGGKVLPK